MSFESPACTTNLRTFDTIKCKYCIALNPSMDSFDNLRMTPLALYSLTAVFITLGYVRCQDLKKSFDSPDQLVMVIRAPPETQMQVSEPSKVRALKWHSFFETCICWGCEIFHVTCLYLSTCLQGYQVSLKSTRGPIDVFLCPEDSSGVCSPVTGSSPSKPNADPSLVPPTTQPTDQSQARTSTSTNAVEVSLSSPASTSSTVTAASQQDPSSLVLGGDSGECSHLTVNKYTFNGIPQSKQLGNNWSGTCPLKGKSCSSGSTVPVVNLN